jgi:hypothetical protein
MKTIKLIPTALLILLSISITAQQGINYKALIKDGGGNVVANQGITVQFIIYEGAALTNDVYQETHSPNSDANGFVIVDIGRGAVDSGVFEDIDWGSDDHYLNVQIDAGGGLTDMGTTQLMAVPYAFHADNAATKIDELIDGKSDNDGNHDGSSVFLGTNAGTSDDASDNRNVGLGFGALNTNTDGFWNTALGYLSLFSNSSGQFNTAVGTYALNTNSVGNNNTAIGINAIANNTSGIANTALGSQALSNNTTGFNNSALGYQAGYNMSTGEGNVFIGYKSGYNETNSNTLYIENSNADPDNALIYGEFDTDILRTNSEFQIGNPTVTGYAFPSADGTINQILKTDGSGSLSWSASVQSINDLTDGKSDNDGSDDGSSLYLGVNAGTNDDGDNNSNVGVGFEALRSNVNGFRNTGIGSNSLLTNTSGYSNTATGFETLNSNSTGYHNTALGNRALNSNETGIRNTALGSNTLILNVDGNENTATGYEALYSNVASSFNTAMGYQALRDNTSERNTAVGRWALRFNTTGDNNTALGFLALRSNLEANDNTAIGSEAMRLNTSGGFNTAIGAFALYSNQQGGNTANGYEALYSNTSGGNNTAVGLFSLYNNTTGSNNTAIGYQAMVPDGTLDNQVRIGNTDITTACIQVAWTCTSDISWKEKIRELPFGLDVLKQLKPVDYMRINNDAKTREMGFIAQDVEALLTQIGYTDQGFLTKDDKGLMSLRYNDFIALLTKAIQEQQEIIENQNKDLEDLKTWKEKVDQILGMN